MFQHDAKDQRTVGRLLYNQIYQFNFYLVSKPQNQILSGIDCLHPTQIENHQHSIIISFPFKKKQTKKHNLLHHVIATDNSTKKIGKFPSLKRKA